MRTTRSLRLLAGSTCLGLTAFGLAVGLAAPASARTAAPGVGCLQPAKAAAARSVSGRGTDHRAVSAAEQRRIEQRTRTLLRARGKTAASAAATSASIPVYVHVMADSAGRGNVTNQRIADQIAVLNKTYGGQESPEAANTGFTFTLAKIDRYYNDAWHRDRQSATYRKRTRLGGKGALNIWLVEFDYLGIATFPWDYARSPGIDGIRVNYDSLPGGGIANYDLGETATHEAGHWLGLYHTFQGGCTATNDEVSDTPAQSSATNGCPAGRDSCSLPGLDPVHNYMDYSYDSCYNQFTPGQSARMSNMWAAYRA